MPQGMKGFQKGRAKTGGRQKGVPARKSTKFLEQLKHFNFNYPRELSEVLLELKNLRKELGAFKPSGDREKDKMEMARRAQIAEDLRFYYGELKSLLPYMAPKLREKEVETVDEPETPSPSTEQISDESLLKALGVTNETETGANARASNKAVLGKGNSQLPVPASSEEDLLRMAGESEEES